MSQMATARALPRLPAQGLPSPRELRVVVGAPKGHAGLVASCLLLLTAGLVAVLLLNTSMARGAFVLNDLQAKSSELADTEAALRHAVDAQSAPAELARQALDLGMVPSGSAAFLRLSDGERFYGGRTGQAGRSRAGRRIRGPCARSSTGAPVRDHRRHRRHGHPDDGDGRANGDGRARGHRGDDGHQRGQCERCDHQHDVAHACGRGADRALTPTVRH